jgi:hypothetical protein
MISVVTLGVAAAGCRDAGARTTLSEPETVSA